MTQVANSFLPGTYGELIKQDDGASSFFLFDRRGSTMAITDAIQTVDDTFIFDGYGNVITHSGSSATPYQFQGAWGYFMDAELGSLYIRRRSYSATIGRWLSFDPLGFVDGANLYGAYFVPNGTDPSGMRLYFNDEFGCGSCGGEYGPTDEDKWNWQDWLDWWQENNGWGDKDVIRSGCIGVAGTICGAESIDKFRDSLTQCYKSDKKAMEEAKGSCKGDCGEAPKIPRIVAIQFNEDFWAGDLKPPARVPWPKVLEIRASGLRGFNSFTKDEPFSAAGRLWDMIDQGVLPLYDNNRNPIGGQYSKGAFDVQILYKGCWLGANQGVPEGGDPSVMDVINHGDDITKVTENPDNEYYSLKIYCVVCCREPVAE